jgi:ketosteroid isomerase-like protein
MDPVEVVREYLKVFRTKDLGRLAELVAEDVEIWGAGTRVRGRHHVEGAVNQAGLSDWRTEIEELFAAGDRVVVYFRDTYHHDATDRDVTMTGMKMYQVSGGRIVRFWGETDLYGLMRQLGTVPAAIEF